VGSSDDHSTTLPLAGPSRVPRAVWHTIGLIVALLLAYLIWRGYQTPDFLLDLSAFRLC
jgi:hypothetical protein